MAVLFNNMHFHGFTSLMVSHLSMISSLISISARLMKLRLSVCAVSRLCLPVVGSLATRDSIPSRDEISLLSSWPWDSRRQDSEALSSWETLGQVSSASGIPRISLVVWNTKRFAHWHLALKPCFEATEPANAVHVLMEHFGEFRLASSSRKQSCSR